MTWRIRGCPRCGGDTFVDKDMNKVWIENCLQCGYYVELNNLDNELPVAKPEAQQKRRQAIRSG